MEKRGQKCRLCQIMIGPDYTEETMTSQGICQSCHDEKNGKVSYIGEKFYEIVIAIYKRAFDDIITFKTMSAIAWVESNDFFFYSDLLGITQRNARKAFFVRIKNKMELRTTSFFKTKQNSRFQRTLELSYQKYGLT